MVLFISRTQKDAYGLTLIQSDHHYTAKKVDNYYLQNVLISRIAKGLITFSINNMILFISKNDPW